MSVRGTAETPGTSGPPAGSGDPAYDVVEAGFPSDRDTILGLWGVGLAEGPMQQAKLRWYYDDNPEGMPRIFVLRATDGLKPVGVATLARRRVRLGGVVSVAAVLVDFIVDPAHRGFFPALFLQRQLLGTARQSHSIIFGIPNPRSEAILRRAGYRRMGDMARMSRVLRSGRYLSRHLPAWLSHRAGRVLDRVMSALAAVRGLGVPQYDFEWRDRAGAEFDSLWSRVTPAGTLMGVRDSAFLNWRFVRSPYHAHRFLCLFGKADGRLVAYAACHVQDEAMHVSDFLVDPAAPGAAKRLWLRLGAEAHRLGHRSLSVVFLGDDTVRRQMLTAGMVARTGRPMYAAFDEPAGPAGPSSWYLTSADEDG